MVAKMAPDLKNLLLASNLGRSQSHPLAGWQVLTILYGDHSANDSARTVNFILQQYNDHYLDQDDQERPLSPDVLKNVLKELGERAKLIEVSSRKVRTRMKSGNYHLAQAPVYKITRSGIEYLSMMQRVLDAENTVTANTIRIDEFCQLVQELSQDQLETNDTQLFNLFENMLSAYSDVMKGMHKVDEDLDELVNDLAFDHGGAAAAHLQAMLVDKAIPAFSKLMKQGMAIRQLANLEGFPQKVARSQQGQDSLGIERAIGAEDKLLMQFEGVAAYANRRIQALKLSFTPTSSAIDSSEDSIYLVLQTILTANEQLSAEYEHIQDQTLDLKQLTQEIDQLLQHYQTLTIPKEIPRHLGQDRTLEDASDLLDATTMGPVIYQADTQIRQVATEADNPQVAANDEIVDHSAAGLAEFQELLMIDQLQGEVTHDLQLKTVVARDEIVRLYSGTGYQHYESFAIFGRPIAQVEPILPAKPIWLHCATEKYSVQLPSGFRFAFSEED